ncbi:MAG: AI-2E family transporter [Pyrinomonadaceae bacterium]
METEKPNKIEDSTEEKVLTKAPERIVKIRRARPTSRRIFLDPSTPRVGSIIRVVVLTLLILSLTNFALGILSALTHLFFLIILSIFFAYLMEPLIKMIRSSFENANRERYMPRPLAIAIAYIAVFSVIGVAVAWLAPLVAEQGRQFSTKLPDYVTSIQTRINEFNDHYIRYRVPEAIQIQATEKAGAVAGELGSGVTNFFIGFLSYLPWLVIIPILAFFFLKDANLFRVQVLRLFPSGDWRSRVESVLHDVNKTLAAYVRAQLISCLLIGSVCTLGFYIIGVNYALLLGIVAGVFEFVPLIGPLTIAVTTIIIASLESPWEALYVFIFLGVLRIVQDYVLYPRIIREGIHLHPLAIILSVLAGEEVAGIPGVFLSIPIVALLTVLYRHVIEHSGGGGLVANILAPKESEIDKTLSTDVPAVKS